MKKILCLILLAFSSASFAFTFQLNRAPLKLKPASAPVAPTVSKPAPAQHSGAHKVYLSPSQTQQIRQRFKPRTH